MVVPSEVEASRGRDRAGWDGKSGMARDESVVTTGEHDVGVVLNEWEGVPMEISEHGVAAPTADDANFVRVNATEE